MEFFINGSKKVMLLFVFLILTNLAVSIEQPKAAIKRKKKKAQTQEQKTDAFYDSLRAKAGRNWFLKNIYPTVFSVDSVEVTIHTDDKSYDRWKGKIIRSIKVQCLEVFLPDTNGKKKLSLSLLKQVGNGLHIKTREWVIRNNLLFHSGDRLSPKVLRRNIAYLRNLDYLSEVQFYVISTKKNSDSVDVLIVTQDKFTIIPNAQYTSISKFSLKIEDQNFLGWGNQLRNEWKIDPQHRSSVGWESYYVISNISRTFIRGDLGWSDLPGYTRKSAALNRPFLYPVLHAAGGAEISETYIRAPVDTIVTDELKLGGWGGYCLKGNPGPANQYAYAALSLQQTWFSKRPEVGLTYGKLWHESLLAIGSLALTQSEYKRLPYMYSFLENEDIPVGYLFEVLLGEEFGEFRNREFIGFHGTRGIAHGNSSFVYLKGGIETFLSRTGTEQGVCLFEPLYISPLNKLGEFHTRTFYRMRIILSNNRLPGETLKLSTDPYFRGNRDLSGQNLIAAGMETDFVSSREIIGTGFTIFAFVDGAIVTDRLSAMNKRDVLLTEGFGVRIRNPHMVFKALELHVAFNQSKGNFRSFLYAIVAKVPLKMIDFEGRRPEPYVFK